MNNSTAISPSAKQPCKECPFRKSNADTEAPQGWYDKDNFERVWSGIARESRLLPCHMFDSEENTGYDSRSAQMGLQKPVALDNPRECAGITAMIHNELQAAQEYPSWQDYIAARPAGLQRSAFKYTIDRMQGNARPALTIPADPDFEDVIDPTTRVDVTSMAWKLGPSGVGSLMDTVASVLDAVGVDQSCTCVVCEKHGSVHAQAQLTTADGTDVSVDKALHGALAIMAEKGVRTTDSCENVRDAMEKLGPHQIPAVLQEALQNPRAISWAEAIRSGQAVIRFKAENEAEIECAAQLRNHSWIFIETGHRVCQITFPLERADEVARIVGTPSN